MAVVGGLIFLTRAALLLWHNQIVAREADGRGRATAPVLRYYVVFNVEQCEGVQAPPVEARPAFERLPECERALRGMANPPAHTLP